MGLVEFAGKGYGFVDVEGRAFVDDLALLAFSGLLLWLRSIILEVQSDCGLSIHLKVTYIIVRLILVVILVILIFFFVILVLKIAFFQILIQLLKLKSLTREPVDSTRDELFLDVLAQLVIKLKTLFDIGGRIIIVLISWCLGGSKEVEEGLSWDSLLNYTGLLGVSRRVSGNLLKHHVSDSLLLRCFLLSTRTVKSLLVFQSILSPSA